MAGPYQQKDPYNATRTTQPGGGPTTNQFAQTGGGVQMPQTPSAPPQQWSNWSQMDEYQRPPQAQGPLDNTQGFMNGPGYGEQWWLQNNSRYGQPTQSSQYWNSVQGKIQGGPQAGQNSAVQQAFGDYYQKPGGTYSEQLYNQGGGNLDAYYNRASQMGQERLDQAMAARGLFNSGAALDESREFQKGLVAEQANREADYRAGLAGQADTSASQQLSNMFNMGRGVQDDRFRADQMGLDYLQAGAGMAGMADNQNLSYLNAGRDSAFGAQGAFEGRNRGNLRDQLDMGNALNNTYGNYANNAIDDYGGLGREQIQAILASAGIGGESAQNGIASLLPLLGLLA